MPAPIKVEMEPFDPAWSLAAAEEATALLAALGSTLIVIHHIGSPGVPGMRAKPIIDLLPVASGLDALDRGRPQIEQLGYEWWGEYGLPGRRYCTKSDPHSGRRLIQLHCWAKEFPEIKRHLAFRDYLRKHRNVADEYAAEKLRCQALHPDDSHAYNDCKNAWIRVVEADALAVWPTGV